MWVQSPLAQLSWQQLLAAPAVAPAPLPLSEPCSLLVPVGVVDCGVTLATMLAEMGGCELVAMLLSGVCTCTFNLQQMQRSPSDIFSSTSCTKRSPIIDAQQSCLNKRRKPQKQQQEELATQKRLPVSADMEQRRVRAADVEDGTHPGAAVEAAERLGVHSARGACCGAPGIQRGAPARERLGSLGALGRLGS